MIEAMQDEGMRMYGFHERSPHLAAGLRNKPGDGHDCDSGLEGQQEHAGTLDAL